MDAGIRKEWIQGFQFILGQQESLLQSYRNYLIVLHSIMAAGAATLLVSLHGEFKLWSGIIYQFDQIEKYWLRASSSAVQFTLLTIFVCYAFFTLAELQRLIRNRGANVTLCQRLISLLQADKFQINGSAPEKEMLKNISINALFKMVEGTEKNETAFGIGGGLYDTIRDYMWGLKSGELGHRPGGTRKKLDEMIVQLFAVIWTAISVFIFINLLNILHRHIPQQSVGATLNEIVLCAIDQAAKTLSP